MRDKKPMPKPTPRASGQTPLEKLNELSRRVIQVPKTVVTPKKALRKHR